MRHTRPGTLGGEARPCIGVAVTGWPCCARKLSSRRRGVSCGAYGSAGGCCSCCAPTAWPCCARKESRRLICVSMRGAGWSTRRALRAAAPQTDGRSLGQFGRGNYKRPRTSPVKKYSKLERCGTRTRGKLPWHLHTTSAYHTSAQASWRLSPSPMGNTYSTYLLWN